MSYLEWSWWGALLVSGACLSAGCGPVVGGENASSDASSSTSSSGTSGDVPSSMTSPMPPPPTSASTSPDPTFPPGTSTTGGGWASTGSSSEVSSDTFDDSGSCNFLCVPDGGPHGGYECDILLQDCPRAEKCTAWANDGGSAWNATRCVPVADQPDGPGEPCTVEGSGVSGIDSCDGTSMCFNVDAETNTGECLAYCEGDWEEPTCDPGAVCQISSDGALVLCQPTCDPTQPAASCDGPEVCIPQNDTFICVLGIGPDSSFLEPCEFPNACSPGLLCAPPDSLDACEGDAGCCTPYCSLEDPSCPGGTVCEAFFNPDEAPDGLEHVGVCLN